MPIFLNEIKFTNPIDGTPINWLLANVGDEVNIEHNISVKTFAVATQQATMVVNQTNGFVGTDQYNITGGNFSDFNVGDQISCKNYLGPSLDFGVYTIVKKPDNNTLILNQAFGTVPGKDTITPTTDNTTDQLAVSLVKDITALVYKWNFIKNSEATNYFSKVDGSTQMASITGLNAGAGGTNKPMTFLGQKPYQIGEITVDEIGLGTGIIYSSDFKIKHKTYLTPAILDIDWDNLVAGVAPDYFFNLECLKAIFFFEARYFVNDPNLPQVLQIDTTIGNTGWFNENWNGNATNYYIENTQFFYTSLSAPPVAIPAIELSTTRKTKFVFNIRNTTDTPFVAGSTKLVINFQKAPNDSGEYTANGRDYRHNFVWDSAILTAQTIPSAVNGDNYADLSLRSLSSLKAYFVSADNIEVRGTFAFDQLGIDVFEESNESRYLFFVSIQDHTKTGAVSDRVTLLVDASANWYQTSFPSLIQMDTKLIPHDVEDYTDTFLDRDKFTEDELVGYTQISIGEDTAVTSVELMKFTASIVMVNTFTGAEFTVDTKSMNLPQTSAIQPDYAGYQNFNVSQNRPFHVPSTEIRKPMIARRNLTIGSAAFEFAYPFLNRWEYWVACLNANSFFFNTAQSNNGTNQDWQHYYLANTWTAQYRFELSTKINGVPAIYSDSLDFKINDRDLIGENTTCEIKTYDPDSLTELVDGFGNKYILGYKNTLVKATFENTTDGFSHTDTTVVLGIEIFEQGGHFGKRRMSSKYDSDSDTWFIPLTGETRTKLTINGTPPINGDTCIAEALIDFNQLSLTNLKWKLTARIYGNDSTLPTTGEIVYGNNYLGTQEVTLIPNNPIQETPTVITPEQLNCCSDLIWRVLASTTDANPLKNDVNSFIWWFNPDAVTTVELSLVNSAGTLYPLTSETSYGTPYNFGFEIEPGKTKNGNGESAVAYVIDWRKVLDELGEDAYYVQCDIETIFGSTSSQVSETYCLKSYTDARANGTVRVEYYLNGLLGSNEKDRYKRDYLQSNWYNQHRFEGVFHYVNSPYRTEEVQYTNGKTEPIISEQDPEYILKLKPIPMFKHNVMRTDILMADSMIVTDYNSRNIEPYYQKEVKNNGSYEPKLYPLQTSLSSVEIKLKQKYSNLKKHRS